MQEVPQCGAWAAPGRAWIDLFVSSPWNFSPSELSGENEGILQWSLQLMSISNSSSGMRLEEVMCSFLWKKAAARVTPHPGPLSAAAPEPAPQPGCLPGADRAAVDLWELAFALRGAHKLPFGSWLN